MFQFHKVRLKEEMVLAQTGNFSEFQFHKVRLKDSMEKTDIHR